MHTQTDFSPANFRKEWITNGVADKQFIKFADKMGQVIHEGKLTTSQIRNFYSSLKTIEMKGFNNNNNKAKFYMLKPLLAYSYQRNKNEGFKIFKEVIDRALEQVMSADDAHQETYFKNLCLVVEAIIAYLTYHRTIKENKK